MKRTQLLLTVLIFPFYSFSQKIDSIYADLYTDSLKKGTYNYINIDGKLSSGRFIPLDTSRIIFTATDGKFYGNSLWIEPNFSKEFVTITATLKSNPALRKQFTLYIKKKPDDEKLKTLNEILNEEPVNPKRSQKKKR
jgi:hypothetical protein